MKNGVYAIYKGKEYKASGKKGQIILFSEDKEDLKIGFNLGVFGDRYQLVVDKQDVDRYYTKTLYGWYKKDTFIIADETDTKYLLLSGPRSYLLSELGFEQTDRGEYIKWVPKEEVSKLEERIQECN